MYDNLDLINELFPLRKKKVPPFKNRPCLNYDLGKCLAPCQNLVSPEDYRIMLSQVEMLLNGEHKGLKKILETEMLRASDDLNFEKAARLRDQIKSLDAFNEKQSVISVDANLDQDVFAVIFDKDNSLACLQVFKTRDGKMVNRDTVEINFDNNDDHNEVFESSFVQYYSQIADSELPKEILLNQNPFITDPEIEMQTLVEWLSERKKSKVTISIPQRGDKYAQIELAKRNAKLMLNKFKLELLEGDSKDINKALENLQSYIGLRNIPQRIECFDISHIQGTNVVASMVCFIDGLPAKGQYRRFKISKEQNNDFENMQEAVFRRYKAYSAAFRNIDIETYRQIQKSKSEILKYQAQFTENNQELISITNDPNNNPPSLIIIDGGKGQLSSAVRIMEDLNLGHIPIVGLAKKEEKIFFHNEKRPLILDRKSPELFLIQNIRNEAHRFAITYHRKLRSKAATRSPLDDIKGLGPRKKKLLLDNLGSLEDMKAMNSESLINKLNTIPTFNSKLIENILVLIRSLNN